MQLKSTATALEMKAYIREHKLNSTSLPSKKRVLLSHNYITMRKKLFTLGHIPDPSSDKVPKGSHRMPDGKVMKNSDMKKKSKDKVPKSTKLYNMKYGTGKDEV
mgnify:CR=1 FL=1|tara:strand:+ start:2983 stop:3294 length:312 start_codon:yes stop_codon:yes gene_type:complete